MCFGLPVVIVLCRMGAERFKRPRILLAIHGILLSIAITDFITNIIKVSPQIYRINSLISLESGRKAQARLPLPLHP